MGKVQSDTFQEVSLHGRGCKASPSWDPIEAKVTSYGPQADGQSPCIIVRKGEDPAPTCVNPQCPKADNCRKHITNRTDPRTPSIAIITWSDCTHYDAIDPEKYKEKKNGEPTR
jgi:hypothetical protein